MRGCVLSSCLIFYDPHQPSIATNFVHLLSRTAGYKCLLGTHMDSWKNEAEDGSVLMFASSRSRRRAIKAGTRSPPSPPSPPTPLLSLGKVAGKFAGLPESEDLPYAPKPA